MNNLLDLFHKATTRNPLGDALRFKSKGKWVGWTWQHFSDKTLQLLNGLDRLGVKAGDRIAILSNTRVEWTLADLAILSVQGISVPIYQSNLKESVCYILKDSNCTGIFVEDSKQLDKILAIAPELPHLRWVAVFSAFKTPAIDSGKLEIHRFKDLFLDKNAGKALFEQNRSAIRPDREMSYVYTSGTTGNPKGAILTHHNFVSNAEVTAPLIRLHPGQEALLFLPLSHIMARLFQFVHLEAGFIQVYAESIDHLFDNIQEVRPHFMVAVPRIFEKVHTKITSELAHASPLRRLIFNWAETVGREAKGLSPRSLSRLLPGTLLLQHELAKRLVYQKLKQKLGGRIRFFISGGAPLAQEIAEFFAAFDILILEGYGLTETTAPVALNLPGRVKFGTVGPALPNCEIRIAEDGEICVKGDMVFKGYFQNPEATRAVLQNGWFSTGDIGRFDSDGFLKITDRKKDIIVTAGGKNIAPQNIENMMKTIPIVSQFVVHGDRRKFLSALVVLDKEEVAKFVAKQGVSLSNGTPPSQIPQVSQYIKDEIDKRNRSLASYESIKRFAILDSEFSEATGELTPTLKVKRRVVEKKYKDVLDQFYHDA